MSPSIKGFSIINGKIQNKEHEDLLRTIVPMPFRADNFTSERNADLVKPLTEEERGGRTLEAPPEKKAESKKKRR